MKTVMLNSKYKARWRNRTKFAWYRESHAPLRRISAPLRSENEIRERYIETDCIRKITGEFQVLNLRTLVAGWNASGLLLTSILFITYCVPPRPVYLR